MTARVATAVVAVVIAGLFFLDRDRAARTSGALWLPAIWLFLGASRMASQWLAGEMPTGAPESYLDGSPFDRLFMSMLIVGALMVLIARGDRTARLLKANGPLVVFFLYCAVSVLWSDYPFVALKRWTKAFGNIAMVLVVLTDPQPAAAVKRLLARTGFLLVPISILFIKYYPALGRFYNRWTWQTMNIGASTDKNGLGTICLLFGLASLWRLLDAIRDDSNPHKVRQCAAHGAVLTMILWLFVVANSSTSVACFTLGAIVLLLTTLPGKQRPANIHVIAAAIGIVPLILAFVLQDTYSYFVEGLGRTTTLTGRTDIWSDLLRMDLNTWLGTGFESFWLGPRAEFFWNKYYFHPNQAHNGYIETYINVGLIGLGLLILIMASGYRNIVDAYRREPIGGSLRLALFIVALIYSVTEAAFKVTHPIWITFLLAVTAVPALSPRRSRRDIPAANAPLVRPRPPIGVGAGVDLPAA